MNSETLVVVNDGLDFSTIDERFVEFIIDASPWLTGDHALRARLGLHELLVNVRRHAYEGRSGPINVGMTASERGLSILVTDWGFELPEVQRRILPTMSEDGGYGLGIIDRVFSDVVYTRLADRNTWLLTLEAFDLQER